MLGWALVFAVLAVVAGYFGFLGLAGLAATIADGVALAEDLMATGQAREKMKEFVDFTQMMSQGGHA